MAGSGVRVSTVQPSLVDTNLITSNLAGKLSSLSWSDLLFRQILSQLCLPFASQARTLLLWRNVRLPWREWPETSSTLKTSREPFSSCLSSPSIFPSQVFLCTHVLNNSNKSLLSNVCECLWCVSCIDGNQIWQLLPCNTVSLEIKTCIVMTLNFLVGIPLLMKPICGQFWTDPVTLSVFSIERRKWFAVNQSSK